MKKLVAFVSSRTNELHNERITIKNALNDFDFNTFIFEDDAGARTESTREVYQEEVDGCHIYIGIFREEYSKPTEEEYDIAYKKNKEILIYLSDFNIKKQDEKLTNLLNKIKQRHSIQKFNDVKDLENKIKTDVARLLAKKFLESIEGKKALQTDFNDLELLKYYLTKISPNHPASLQLINSVASEIMTIWNIMGYKIDKCSFENTTIVFEGEITHWSGTNKVLIRCVNGEITIEDVSQVQKFLELNQDYEGFIFTFNRISDSAKQLALKSPKITVQTQAEFYRKILSPDKYIQEFKEKYESSEIPKYYVNLDCYKESRLSEDSDFSQEDYGDLEKYVDKWLKDKSQKHLSLLGEFGSGKTWFTRRFAKTCLDKYLNDPDSNRLPIFISLRDYAKSYSIKQLITDLLINEYGFQLRGGFEVFEELNNQGKFLLIFDGFDEMAQKVDYGVVVENFGELAKVATPNSKVLLTCRTTYFRYEIESQNVLGGKEKTATLPTTQTGFEIIHINEFSEEKILEVMTKRIGNEDEAKDYWNKLKPVYDVPSIAHKPLLIPMLIEVMPYVLDMQIISPSIIYYIYTSLWIKKSHQEGRSYLKTEWESLFFVKELAWYMIKTQNLRMSWKKIPEFIDEHFHIDSKELDYYSHDLRTNTFLRRDEKGIFEFSHKSITEFFVAFKFALELGNIKSVFSKDIPQEELQQKSLNELSSTFGYQVLNPEIALFLKDLIDNKENLRYLFYSSKQNLVVEHPGFLTSNLITLLITMNESFQNEDISRANIPNAELSNASLINCRFDGGNLSDCNMVKSDLRESSFSRCNFAGSNLQYANFSKCILEDANLTNCNGRFSNFLDAEIPRSNLTNGKFQRSKFINTNLENVTALSTNFTDCDMTDANFEGSIMDKCSFESSVLTRANFKNSQLTDCIFYDAGTTGIQLTNCNLKNSKLENLELSKVKFGSANLENAILIHSTIIGGRFTGANLMNCNLINANLSKCDFEQSDLTGAKLDNANLSDSKFQGCILKNAELERITSHNLKVDEKTNTKGAIIDRKTFATLPKDFQQILIRDNPQYSEFQIELPRKIR